MNQVSLVRSCWTRKWRAELAGQKEKLYWITHGTQTLLAGKIANVLLSETCSH
jgi:hypothetical protein